MSNHYKKKATKKNMLEGFSPATKEHKAKELTENLKETAKDTGIDIVAAVGGGLAGSAIGRPSFFTGVVVSGLSHFLKKHIGQPISRFGSVLGVGMMSGGISKTPGKGVNGLGDASHTEAAKERMTHFHSDLKERLYLDKLPIAKKKTEEKKSSTTKEETKPVGDLTTFEYPETEPRKHQLDLNSLDEFEEKLHESAQSHLENKRRHKGEHEGGIEGMGEFDHEEKNY